MMAALAGIEAAIQAAQSVVVKRKGRKSEEFMSGLTGERSRRRLAREKAPRTFLTRIPEASCFAPESATSFT
jgi:hypothetical protein